MNYNINKMINIKTLLHNLFVFVLIVGLFSSCALTKQERKTNRYVKKIEKMKIKCPECFEDMQGTVKVDSTLTGVDVEGSVDSELDQAKLDSIINAYTLEILELSQQLNDSSSNGSLDGTNLIDLENRLTDSQLSLKQKEDLIKALRESLKANLSDVYYDAIPKIDTTLTDDLGNKIQLQIEVDEDGVNYAVKGDDRLVELEGKYDALRLDYTTVKDRPVYAQTYFWIFIIIIAILLVLIALIARKHYSVQEK